MIDLVTHGWKGYELIDSGDGKRLERFGDYVVIRPDSSCIWEPTDMNYSGWSRPDLEYVGRAGSGEWRGKDELLEGWTLQWDKLKMRVVPTPFRHLAVFPEQAAHWKWMSDHVHKARNPSEVRILNLFAYTGAASVVGALAGAQVCHVDSSKSSTFKAKENAKLSGLPDTAIRWILEDAIKFMRREVRRGNRYDLIIMDPPVFGRGSQGEIWRLENGISQLAMLAGQLLSDRPLGFLMNFYATTLYPEAVLRLVSGYVPLPLTVGALHLEESISKKCLQTGYFLRS